MTDAEAVMAQSLRQYVATINPVVEGYIAPYLDGAVQRLVYDLYQAGFTIVEKPK